MATDTPAKAPVAEIGYQVAAPNYWWQYENETTPELQFPQSVTVFDQMRRTDGQVKSVLNAVTLPVLRTPWRLDPAGAREEVVRLVADDLGLPIVGRNDVVAPVRLKDRFSWIEHLRLSLLMLPFGFSYFEQVYRVDDDGSRAHLRKLAYRPPTSIEMVDVAEDGGLVAIKQYWTQKNSQPKPIPVNRLVAYVFDREGGNWLGTSILRPVYKNWLLKDRLLRVWAQTIERNGMGIPVYEGADGEVSLTAGLTMATSLRAGEAAGAATPFGAKLRLMGVEGTLPDAKPAVEYHDQQIARAVLAHFLNLGQQTGSWALGSTFADFFTLSLQTLAQQVADTATQHVVEDLVDVNWGPGEPAPRLVFDEIGSRQPATAEAMKTLVDAGVLHPDEVLETATRQFYGLPPADPATATPAPGEPSGETVPAQTETGEYSVAASTTSQIADEASWIAAAAGVDMHPGGEQLKRWWVYGEGAAKWATWTELYDHLKKYIKNKLRLRKTVSAWYRLRYGHNPPRHKVAASSEMASPEALQAFAALNDPDFGEYADDEAEDWELSVDALSAALDELSGAVAASFNPRQPRNPKGTPGAGRFRSMVDRLKDALTEHRESGGKGDDPFEGFDREQLRRAAVKRGISLERKESRESIAKKLLDDLDTKANPKAKSAVQPAAPKTARRPKAKRRLEDDAALDAAPLSLVFGRKNAVGLADATLAGDIPAHWSESYSGRVVYNLDWYRGSYYTIINEVTRNHQDDYATEEMVEVIDNSLAHSPLKSSIVTYRGIKDPMAVFGLAWPGDGSAVGLMYVDYGYSSTSVDQRVARYAAKPGGVTIRLFVPAGVGAIKLSDFGPPGDDFDGVVEHEAELLLQRRLSFRVIADHGFDAVTKQRKLDVEVTQV